MQISISGVHCPCKFHEERGLDESWNWTELGWGPNTGDWVFEKGMRNSAVVRGKWGSGRTFRSQASGGLVIELEQEGWSAVSRGERFGDQELTAVDMKETLTLRLQEAFAWSFKKITFLNLKRWRGRLIGLLAGGDVGWVGLGLNEAR